MKLEDFQNCLLTYIPYILIMNILIYLINSTEFVDQTAIPVFNKSEINVTRHSHLLHSSERCNKKHVIIWTYMRSGSTLTAEVLSRISNTYYIEEPLNRFRGNKKPVSKTEGKTLQDLLGNILKCNFSHPKEFWGKFLQTKDLMWMWPQRDLHNDKEIRDLMKLESTGRAFCEAADVVLVKQVTLGIASAIEILKDASLNSYIIHLVRDPRGTFSSTRNMLDKYNNHKSLGYKLDDIMRCRHLRQDLQVAKIIRSTFPQRYLQIKYEELISDMDMQVLKTLQWLDVPYGIRIAANIVDQTMGFYFRKAQNSLFHPYRNTSTIRFAWRKKMSYKDVAQIQEGCRDVMEELGYRIYNSIDEFVNPFMLPLMDNLTFSSISDATTG